MLQRIATASGRAEELNLDRWAEKGAFPDPFDGYRNALRERLSTLVVSHKPDHGLGRGAQGNVHVTSGRLHEETAYGLVADEIDGKAYNLVTRKPISELKENQIATVRDPRLREALEEVAFETLRDREDLKPSERDKLVAAALAEYGRKNGIRRVRVLKTEKGVVTVRHGGGRYSKAYSPGDNHRVEIFEMPGGEWLGEGVTVFDANTPDHQPGWRTEYPEALLIMRLHNGDSIEADFGEGRRIWRVVRLEPSAKRVRLVRDIDAGNLEKRHKAEDDSFRWNFATYKRLREAGARRVRVDPIGRVSSVEDR